MHARTSIKRKRNKMPITTPFVVLVVFAAMAQTSLASPTTGTGVNSSENITRAKLFLKEIDDEISKWNNKMMKAAWKYSSNITDENLKNQMEVSAGLSVYVRGMIERVNAYPWQNINDYSIQRQFQKFSMPESFALSDEKRKLFEEVINNMQTTYSTAKVCDYNKPDKCDLNLEPELTDIFATSREPERLKHLWKAFRDASGKKVKADFIKYVELSNEIARLNNHTDMAEYWIKEYEADDFIKQIESLWQQIRPLYLQLHAYVRRQLRLKYGEDVVSKDGPIPAHLLGNMWGQTWGNIADFTVPFPGKKIPDVTDEMVRQNFDAKKIFLTAENFFTSLNLSALPDTFWSNSILKKPEGVELICHASSWDFHDGKDFRIKQCTGINMEDLLTTHHEMGHIQYFLQYKDQPFIFKKGANPGFHEAVGDTIALSALTPEHLKEIGLLNDSSTEKEADINHQYFRGLEKIAFLPFAYMMDKWRWEVFQGKIKPETYNQNWWKLAFDFQGISPPVDRSEDDFDPGAKYHIVANVEYIRYFVSKIVQFQFHKALCIKAGQFDPMNPLKKPLSQCNIYNSKEAGQLFKSMLQMGSSKPWQDAMEEITGQREMDASGLLEYFKPLMDMLEADNKKNGEYIGWKNKTKGNTE